MNMDADLIETLIPITILITALINIVERFSKDTLGAEKRDWRMKYVLALAFGLIHGLGFLKLPEGHPWDRAKLGHSLIFIQCWFRTGSACNTCHYIIRVSRYRFPDKRGFKALKKENR